MRESGPADGLGKSPETNQREKDFKKYLTERRYDSDTLKVTYSLVKKKDEV